MHHEKNSALGAILERSQNGCDTLLQLIALASDTPNMSNNYH